MVSDLLDLAWYTPGTQYSGRSTQSEFVRSSPAGPLKHLILLKIPGKARRNVYSYRMTSVWSYIPSASSVPSLSCREITTCSASCEDLEKEMEKENKNEKEKKKGKSKKICLIFKTRT